MARKTTAAGVKKRGSYHHGNLKEALLQAAAKRIGESQEFDFRLRDLAEDCGVQLAACYRHFGAKSDVLVELARRGFVALEAALAALPADEDPARALAELGAAYVTFAVEAPVAYLAMFHPALAHPGVHAELDEAAGRTLLELRAAVVRALGKAGDARTVDRVVFQAWAGVHGYASLLVSRDRERATPLVEQAATKKAILAYTEMLTRGMLAPSR
ncbi:MAG: TetR/AcrR family transcriptional regulator [Polyangiaceae bacterium]|nr:TetR/AcrR family transcriptional regulator [Polyangiaceae bacterium]